MGDKKPKKNSSGNSDAHKAKQAKTNAERMPVAPKPGPLGGQKKK